MGGLIQLDPAIDVAQMAALVLDAGTLDERAELRGGAVENGDLGLHLHE